VDPVESPVGSVVFWLVIAISSTLIPAIFTWWLLAQHMNNRLANTETPPRGVRWHFLRFGPTALLVSAAGFSCGLWIYSMPERMSSFSPYLILPAMALMGSGVLAFMMSMVLWAYSNSPPKRAWDAD